MSNQETLIKLALLTGIVITLAVVGLTIGIELFDHDSSSSSGSDDSDSLFPAFFPSIFFPAILVPIIASQQKKKQEEQGIFKKN